MSELIDRLRELLGAGGVLSGDEARRRSGSWGVNHCDALAVLPVSYTHLTLPTNREV